MDLITCMRNLQSSASVGQSAEHARVSWIRAAEWPLRAIIRDSASHLGIASVASPVLSDPGGVETKLRCGLWVVYITI